MPADEHSPEFLRGWEAALRAAGDWHDSKAKRALVLAKRSRFPKNLEREAELHKDAAEAVLTLSPDDV